MGSVDVTAIKMERSKFPTFGANIFLLFRDSQLICRLNRIGGFVATRAHHGKVHRKKKRVKKIPLFSPPLLSEIYAHVRDCQRCQRPICSFLNVWEHFFLLVLSLPLFCQGALVHSFRKTMNLSWVCWRICVVDGWIFVILWSKRRNDKLAFPQSHTHTRYERPQSERWKWNRKEMCKRVYNV